MRKLKRLTVAWLVVGRLIIAVAGAEEITTTDGKIYKDVSVNRAEPDGIVISYQPDGGGNGIAKIKFIKLSESLQQKYKYDAGKAAAFKESQARFESTLQAKLWADYRETTNRNARQMAREQAQTAAIVQDEKQSETIKRRNLNLETTESLQAKANGGDDAARRELAERNYHRWRETRTPEDREKTISSLRPFADAGDDMCQIYISYALMDGTWYNFEEGMNYLLKPAERGNTEAMNALGIIYLRGGPGMPIDKAKATKWYRMAAERGVISTSLGQLYESDGNYVEALKWYELARRRERSATAIAMCDALQNKMSGDQIAEARRQADEFKPLK